MLILIIAALALLITVIWKLYWTIEFYAQSTIYDHPSKCFDCEKDAIARFGPEYGWIGQKTKSFDAEREAIATTGDIGAAIDTHTIKYY